MDRYGNIYLYLLENRSSDSLDDKGVIIKILLCSGFLQILLGSIAWIQKKVSEPDVLTLIEMIVAR